MAKLYFRVASDWQEVVRLRQEIDKLKATLKTMDSTQSPVAFKTMNSQLSEATKKMDGMVTEAAKAGAKIEGGFKKKIYDASQVINGLTEKIISQRAVIKDIEADVRKLGEAYRTALKKDPLRAGSKLVEYNSARKALDEEKAALFGLSQQQAEARLSVKKLRDEYAMYKDDAKEVSEANNGLSISWKKALAVIGGGAMLKGLVSDMIRVRGEFKAADTAIQTLLGSKEKADELMSEVREYAMISPLEFSDVTKATQMMLGFNIEAEKVPRFLSAIGDVSMGKTGNFNSLTLAFSQMSAAGKLMGQDLNQMINAGFNPLLVMSEKTGKSMASLKDEMSKGAISAEMVQQAFIDATSAGGKFYKMSENASQEIEGQISMMNDAIKTAYNEVGAKTEGVIIKGIQLTTEMIKNYEHIGKAIVGLVGTYGTYRTAIMLTTVMLNKHKVSEIALINIRWMARKAQLALNAAMLTNPYVALATVVTGLVGVIWALSDSSTAAERAQKKLREEQDKLTEKEEKRRSQIDSLIRAIKDETETELAKITAYEQLQRLSPALTSAYKLEELAVLDLAEANKLLNKERDTNTYDSYIRNIEESSRRLEKLKKDDGRLLGISPSTGIAIRVDNREKIKEEEEYLKGQKAALKRFSDRLMSSDKKEETSYKQDFEKAKKEWDEAKKKLSEIEKDKEKFTSKQYQDAKKDAEAKEKAYKDLGGLTGGALTKAENQAKKVAKEQEKYTEELLALRRKNQQDEISIMNEGSEKRIKQAELNYAKEKDAIEKQRNEWKKDGPLSDLQNEVLANAEKVALEQKKNAIEDAHKAETEANDRYLVEYGSFLEKKEALTRQFEEKKRKAETEGDKAILDRQLKDALASLEFEKFQKGINWELVFNDLGKVSKKYLKDLEGQLRKIKSSNEYQAMTIEQKKIVEESLNSVNNAIIDKGGLLGDLPDQLDNLRIAQEELTEAQEAYNKAVMEGTEEQKNAALERRNMAMKGVQNAQTNVSKSTDETTRNLITLSGVIGDLGSSSEMSLSAIGGLASEVINVFSESGSKIGGIVGAILSLLDGIGNHGLDGFLDNVFGSVFRAIGGIWDTLTFGLIGVHESDPNLKNDIELLTQSNSELRASVDNLSDKMDESAVAEAPDIYDKQVKNISEAIKNTQEMMARSGAAYSKGFLGIGGTHSSNKYIDDAMSAEEWRRISDITGETVRNAGDFWNLTSQEMALVRDEAADLYSKIKTYADNGHADASKYMDEYVSYYKQLQELEESFQEKITSTSFHSIQSDFENMITDMESSTDDFTDYFEKKLKEAVLKSMMSDTYSKKLKDWYKKFTEAMKDGTLSGKDEKEPLKKEWDAIVQEAIKERDELLSAIGLGIESQQSQFAPTRGFATEMTHEDAGELSGRFTALQITGEEILTVDKEIRNIADESRDIIANSYLELVQISENTGAIVKPIIQIQKDIEEVKKNTSRI